MSPSRRAGEVPPRAYLDICLEGGEPWRRVLAESHLIIGRVPGVGLLLDHHTVSRRHAEMFCDPFGRFWIRDLGSTNGTFVGGEPVMERVLSPGERIAIGDFALVFDVEQPERPRDPRSSRRPEELSRDRESLDMIAYEEESPTAIRTLVDLEPPQIAAGHLRTLLELSRRLIGIPEPLDRADALASLIVSEDFLGTMAVVLRSEGRKIRMISRPHWSARSSSRTPKPAPDARQYISRRVLETVRQTREPVLATNVASGVGPSSVEMSLSRGIGDLWVIAVPFRAAEGAIDVLYATIPRDCGNAEWLSLYALAAEVYMQGEASWAARLNAQAHAAIERELETARQIQHGLVPPDYSGPGLEVTVGFQPCKWVGGDYVDVIPLPRGRVLLAIADVCGKGIQAALVGSSLHTMVRAAVDIDPPLSELMERVNRHLLDWLPEHSFVTMVAVALDPATGELECVNAGHPPVMIVGPSGTITELQAAENPALGIDQTRMIADRARLAPGEVLAMYTDGLTELTGPSGEMFGQDRLADELGNIYVARHRSGVSALAAELDARLDAFRGDEVPGDDRTYLLAQRH